MYGYFQKILILMQIYWGKRILNQNITTFGGHLSII
jgi:hypothetical protein